MRLPRADWLCVHIPHRIYAISALILGLLSPVSQLLSLACILQKGPRASPLSGVSQQVALAHVVINDDSPPSLKY